MSYLDVIKVAMLKVDTLYSRYDTPIRLPKVLNDYHDPSSSNNMFMHPKLHV